MINSTIRSVACVLFVIIAAMNRPSARAAEMVESSSVLSGCEVPRFERRLEEAMANFDCSMTLGDFLCSMCINCPPNTSAAGGMAAWTWCGGTNEEFAQAVCAFIKRKRACPECLTPPVDSSCPPEDCNALTTWLAIQLTGVTCSDPSQNPVPPLTPELLAAIVRCSGCTCGNPVICPEDLAGLCDAVNKTLTNALACFESTPPPAGTSKEQRKRDREKALAQAICNLLDQCPKIPSIQKELEDKANDALCGAGETGPNANPIASVGLAVIQCIAKSGFKDLTEDGSRFLCELFKCSSDTKNEICGELDNSGMRLCDANGNGTASECEDLALIIELKKACNCANCEATPPAGCEPTITASEARDLACKFFNASTGCGQCGTPTCAGLMMCLQTIEEIDPADYCSIMNGSCAGSTPLTPPCVGCGGEEPIADLIKKGKDNSEAGDCADLANVPCDQAGAALEGLLLAIKCARSLDPESLSSTDQDGLAELICEFLAAVSDHNGGCTTDCDDVASAAVTAFGAAAARSILDQAKEKCGATEADPLGCKFPDDLSQLGKKRKRKICPGSQDKSKKPVDLTTGDKFEREVDLVVALPGEDFVFDRSYSSGPFRGAQVFPSDWTRAPIGAGWTSSHFMTIEEIDSNTLRLHGENADEFREFARTGESGPFRADGADGDEIVATGSPVVWKLIVPGVKTVIFKRVSPPGGSAVNARGYVDSIEYATGRRDEFVYQGGAPLSLVDPGIAPDFAGRPVYLYLGMYGSETQEQARARLAFTWNSKWETVLLTTGPSLDMMGTKLVRVAVERPVGGQWVETNRVEYTYLNDQFLELNFLPLPTLLDGTTPDPLFIVPVSPGDECGGIYGNRGLGSRADLIQVIRVDHTLTSPDAERLKVTQYRYHSTEGHRPDLTTGITGVGSPSLVTGFAHQLRMVINPEQIEWAAMRLAGHLPESVGGSTPPAVSWVPSDAWTTESKDAVRVIAQRLLYYRDEDFIVKPDTVSGAAGTRLIDLASKVIGYDGQGRVREQFLQGADGCGCGSGGSASRGVLEFYKYIEGTTGSGPSTQTWFTTWISEYTYDKSFVRFDCRSSGQEDANLRDFPKNMEVAFRERRYDYLNDASGVAMLMFEAVSERPTPGSTDWWVTAYEYSTNAGELGALVRVANPSAIATYTPASDVGSYAAPSTTERSGEGLVYHHAVSSDGERVVETRVGTGGSTFSTAVTIETNDYVVSGTDVPSGSYDYWRSLPKSTTRHVWEAGSVANDFEVQTFVYGFDTASSSSAPMVWRQVGVEIEPTGENGPSGLSATEYTTVDVYDARGDLVWSKAADFAVTRFERDDQNGEVTAMSSNVNSSTPGWLGDPVLSSPNNLSTTSWGLRYGQGSSNWDGGVLTTSYMLDLAGRQVGVRRPAPTLSDANETFTIRTMAASLINPTVQVYREILLPDKQGSDYAGPAQLTEYTAGDQVTHTSSWVVTEPSPGSGLSGYLSAELSRSETEYSAAGAVMRRKVWDRVGSSTPLIEKYSYDNRGRLQKRVKADGLVEWYDYTVPGQSYTDNRDRVRSIYVGDVDGSSFTGNTLTTQFYYDATIDNSGDPTILTNGDGNLTLIRQWYGTGSGEYRDTYRVFDARNRLVQSRGPLQGTTAIGPHEVRVYDNLDRLVERAMFSTTGGLPDAQGTSGDASLMGAAAQSGNDFLLYSQAAYNQRGLQYRTDISTDAEAARSSLLGETDLRDRNVTWSFDALVNESWFDGAGRTLVNIGPSGPKSKRSFDGHGRVVLDWSVAGAASPYQMNGDGALVSSDYVLEQTKTEYDLRGRPWLTTKWMRRHDDSATGDLTGSGHDAVKSFVGFRYDDSDRLRYTINFGTAMASFETGGTAPSLNDVSGVSPGTADPYEITSALVDEIGYNSRGLVGWTRKASGEKPTSGIYTIADYTRRTAYLYDALNRQVAVIENADEALDPETAVTWSTSLNRWVVGSSYLNVSDPSQNRTTSTVYDAGGRVAKQVAHIPTSSGEDVQITEYVYGVSTTTVSGTPDSLVSRPDLLREARYPDESTGQPSTGVSGIVRYGYNVQGELMGVRDQNGTLHTYVRDFAGRVTQDGVSDFPSDYVDAGTNTYIEIDDAIKALNIEYDGAGRIHQITSTDAVTSGTVKNGVGFTYTPLWQVAKVVQNSTGLAFSSGTTPHTSAKVVENVYDTDPYNTSLGTQANHSRLDKTLLPAIPWATNTLPWEFNYYYGDFIASDINDRVSRISEIGVTGKAVAPVDSDWGWSAMQYNFAGMGTVVGAEMGNHLFGLDRTWSNGATYADRKRRLSGFDSQAAGVYPGLDRFGRVIRHAWLDWHVGKVGGGGFPLGAHDGPAIFEETHTYDKLSNRLTSNDGRSWASWNARDAAHTYDRLSRLTRTLYSPAGTPGRLSQDWSLDVLGNWMSNKIDYTFNGSFSDSGDLLDARGSNQANELLSRTRTYGGVTFAVPMQYDRVGNLGNEGQNFSNTNRPRYFRHDAWNRLVEVREVFGSETHMGRAGRFIASYAYNGLHWRIEKKVDLDANGDADRTIGMSYDASWRLVQEEHLDQTDGSGPVTAVTFQQAWGTRYIDDAIMRFRCDLPSDPYETGMKAFYQLSDAQFSVVAVLDEGANVVERMRYLPYGSISRSGRGDVNGDGVCDSDDEDLFWAALNKEPGDPEYTAELDLDRSGLIESGDYGVILAGMGDPVFSTLQLGNMSINSPGPRNTVGYCGYVFNGETRLYTVRFRNYSPTLGRWLERDPAGYVDGMGLYEYVRGRAVVRFDPRGLCACSDDGLVPKTGAGTLTALTLQNDTPPAPGDMLPSTHGQRSTGAMAAAAALADLAAWFERYDMITARAAAIEVQFKACIANGFVPIPVIVERSSIQPGQSLFDHLEVVCVRSPCDAVNKMSAQLSRYIRDAADWQDKLDTEWAITRACRETARGASHGGFEQRSEMEQRAGFYWYLRNYLDNVNKNCNERPAEPLPATPAPPPPAPWLLPPLAPSRVPEP